MVSTAVGVVDEDQTNDDRADEKGQKDVDPLLFMDDVAFGGSEHLGNGHVQKDTTPEGEDGSDDDFARFHNQDQQATNDHNKTEQKVQKERSAGSNPVLVDHDQISRQLVGNFVDDGGSGAKVATWS